MANCKCALILVDNNSFVIVDVNQCSTHRDKSLAETFRLRSWIINEGAFYNSYREDTGIKAQDGLVFKDSPWNYNQFICDLSSYLKKEPQNGNNLLIGVNLFADGILTSAQGSIRFSEATIITENEAFDRMDAYIKKYLSSNEFKNISENYIEIINKKIKNDWFDTFINFDFLSRITKDSTRTKFETAIKNIIDKQKLQESLAAQSEDQIQVLTNYIKELENDIHKLQINHQMEVSLLRAQMQKLSENSSNKPTEWICNTCTFFNPLSSASCSMCGTQKS